MLLHDELCQEGVFHGYYVIRRYYNLSNKKLLYFLLSTKRGKTFTGQSLHATIVVEDVEHRYNVLVRQRREERRLHRTSRAGGRVSEPILLGYLGLVDELGDDLMREKWANLEPE